MGQYDDEIQKGLLDFLTSSAQHQSKTNVLLQEIRDNLKAPSAPIVSQGGIPAVELKAKLETGNLIPYQLITIAMDSAGTDVQYNVDIGGNMVAASDGSLNNVTVKFGIPRNEAIPLLFFVGQQIPVTKMYVTWPAQAGKTLYILIGMLGVAAFELSSAYAKSLSSLGQQTIYSAMPPGIGTYYSTNVNAKSGKRLMLYVVSTLDQAVSVQPFGNKADATTNIALMLAAVVMPIGSVTTQVTSFTINLDDLWHPYIGVQIITLAAPTVGTLVITADVQE